MTQPDSIIPDPYNPLDWNRYAYVRYNPVNNTDPTGHRVCSSKSDCEDYALTPSGRDQWIIPISIEDSVDAEQEIMLNDPLELMTRIILGEEGGKLFTDTEDDAYGVGWAVLNRKKSGYYKDFSRRGINPRLKIDDDEYGNYEWYWASASSIYGLHTRRALDPIGSGEWGSVDKAIRYYNRAREIAKDILTASEAEDITGYPGYYMEWYDAQNADGSNPYERTHFRVKDKDTNIIAHGFCVTTAAVCR